LIIIIIMNKKSKNIAIIGIYPPPYGGVSVSLQRLVPYLDEKNIDYVIYNTGRSKPDIPFIENVGWSPLWVLKMLFFSRHNVIQLSTSRWWARLYGALLHICTGAKIIIYARGYSLTRSYEQGGKIKRYLIRKTLENVHTIISTNYELAERIQKFGFDRNRIKVVYPFIPPSINGGLDNVPPIVKGFAGTKSHIIAANGGYVYIDGRDVYGLRVMVSLMKRLVQLYPDIGLIVYLRRGADKDEGKFYDLKQEVYNSGLKYNILFHTSDHEFYPLLNMSDLFLRPTSTDGDANSIREAFYFGVPVIASDVVPRPEGTILYKYGNDKQLYQEVVQVLSNINDFKKSVASLPVYNSADHLIKIYRELTE
jgi:glycosyltransferase involved in cell wall biosynthesis